MTFQKLEFRPGIYREITRYANTGGWYDCDKIRFRDGKPEKIGGWQRRTGETSNGIVRSLKEFRTLNGEIYLAAGTNIKLYLERGEALYDITPYRKTSSSVSNPFDTTNGDATVTVTDNSHGALVGDYIQIEGASATGGIGASDLNGERIVTSVPTTDTFTFEAGASATSTTTGGGSVDINYEIHVGIDEVVVGTGWGTGGWGEGGWGDASDSSDAIAGGSIRLWSFDTFGEDLVACARDQGIYYWDATNGDATRAFPLENISGAQDVPTVATTVLVSDRDRHVIAFGCDSLTNPGVQDPMLVRWSDQENAADWRPSTTNTSGDFLLSSGSKVEAVVETRQEILIFTDSSLHTMRYIGGTYVFSQSVVARNANVVSFNAAVSQGDFVYWMGDDAFYVYSGPVRELPCSVKEYVFSDINRNQRDKIYAGANTEHSEIIWFYPSAESSENDRYVIFNYQDNIWYIGTLGRTAWEDRVLSSNPTGASVDSYLYYHEVTNTDGSTNPPSLIEAHIESSPFEVGDGYNFMFLSRLIPDVDFRTSGASSPGVLVTLKSYNAPGAALLDSVNGNVVRTATIPVEQYDEQKHMRLRGRSFTFRIEDQSDPDESDVSWRLGIPRIDIRTDGRR